MAPFDWTFCIKLFVLHQAGCTVLHSSRVELSTCEAPMADSRLSLCCHTRNIPDWKSIHFYVKQAGSTETTRTYLTIKPTCSPVFESAGVDLGFTVADKPQCDSDGDTETVYKVTLSLTYSEATGNQWECGFYGSTSSWTISPNQVLTMYHGDVLRDDGDVYGDTATLNWTLNGPVTHPTTVDVYGPSGGQVIHAEDRNVTYHTGGFTLTGDVLSGNIGLKFDEDLPQLNGTYVCVYNTTGGVTVRDGVTLVFIGQPKTPTLIASQPEATSTEGVVSGRIDCVTSSQSAAPLYYKPELVYKWTIPSDDPNFSDVTNDGNHIHIQEITCNTVTSSRVYCQVTEGSQTSYHSDPMNLSTFCINTSKEHTSSTGGIITSWIIAIIIGLPVMMIVVGVVGRVLLSKRRAAGTARRESLCQLIPNVERSDRIAVQQAIERIGIEESLQAANRRGTNHSFGADFEHFDSDLETALRQSSAAVEAQSRQSGRGYTAVGLDDGLARSLDEIAMEQAIERIAIEESVQDPNERGNNPSFGNERAAGWDVDEEFPREPAFIDGPRSVPQSDPSGDWCFVERLLEQHNKHLNGRVQQKEVDRSKIVHDVLQMYDDPEVATSRLTIKMTGELGMDCGGVTEDMFTTFWYKVQESYFQGCEMVVPFLPINRWDIEEHYYRTFGRILSHTVAVTKAIPLPICKSAIIVMIFDTTNVDRTSIVEDFLFFLDQVDRQLVTTGMNKFKALTEEQVEELQSIFIRFDYSAVIKETTFNDHLTRLARNTICIRPKPLLDLMREGIPQPHFQHFWGMFSISRLKVLFQALRPTANRVIASMKTDPAESSLSRKQRRVFRFLHDFLNEISQPEIETFLHFLTASKSKPRQPIVVSFNKDAGFQRAPRAHTCSNVLELPETYENYKIFRSEWKHLLAAEETMTMSMA